MSELVDDALLDDLLVAARVALEVHHSEVDEKFCVLLVDLALANGCRVVLHHHAEDLLDGTIGEEAGELVRVERFFLFNQ